jgi:predicted MFS family arabinose efflux permease
VTQVLKLPAYRRLLAAYTLNELAWSVGSLALAVLVYRRTGSAFGAMAFFLCSQPAPALLSPLAVARLDQLDPGRILPLLYAIEGVLFLALAWVASSFALAPVLALAALDGIVAVSATSLARAATVAVTSPAGLLREGNALINACFSVCFMAGPALGGLIVVAGGTTAALLANVAVFALITLTLATTSSLPAASSKRGSSAGRLRAALSYARTRRPVGVLLCLQATALAFFTIATPVEVVFAQHSLHAGAAGYAALLSAWGAGAVAGSAVYARWRALPARLLIALGAGVLGIGFLVMALAPSLALASAGAAIGGVSNGVESISVQTALQERVEQRWMALILSLLESIKLAVPGIGIVLGGAIAGLAGPRAALAVAGTGALGVMVAAWVVLSPATFSTPVERDPPGVRSPAAGTARR